MGAPFVILSNGQEHYFWDYADGDTRDEYLRDWPTVILYGGKRSLQGQIVVGTLDTIATQLGGNGFGHGYFDLVVTDEGEL